MIAKILLGNTGLFVSRIGLGTVKFGRNQGVRYPASFALPSDRDIDELLSYARDLGINLLDTAPAYGLSEERLGHALKKNRKDFILCTKVGEEFADGQSHFDFGEKSVRKSIERSLQRLKTDELDIVLVHSNGEDSDIIEKYCIFEVLQTYKQAGIIRAYGMSTKTLAGGMQAVDQSDIVMVTYNPIYPDEQPVIAYAKQKNKAVLIKKALASGHIETLSKENPVETAINFIFREPGVHSVIVGTLNKEHLREVIECARLTII
ncbi:MAG: putative oxidoreductase [uncultured bacterium]|nr:MAG: putative oxidoreductase [uncultured bacterium]